MRYVIGQLDPEVLHTTRERHIRCNPVLAQFIVICIGHSTSIYMNGHLVTQFVDTDPKYFRTSGKIGIESESTGDVYVRNISIRKLP